MERASMYLIGRFLSNSKSKVMEDKQKRSKPKLVRTNAVRNIDYDASSTSSFDDASFLAHSIDLSLLDDRTSFRVEGLDGQFELICRSLGFSGPEDFAIPPAAWEANKVRSLSESQSELRVFDGGGVGDDLCFHDSAELSGHLDDAGSSSNGSSCGIKGARPPLLEPPLVTPHSVIHGECSTLDALNSPSPGGRGMAGSSNIYGLDKFEGFDQGGGVEERRLVETPMFSESSSPFASNDEDSCSTTSEPMLNISPNGRLMRNITSWQKGDLLGRGSFGLVYEGISDDGFFFAVKEVSLLDQGIQGKQSIYYLEQEIDLLSQFQHENIVRYLGTDKVDSKLYIFLELVTKGSIQSLYQRYNLRDSQVSAYTRQILHGLKYLHDRGVVHRDIKCSNILVDVSGSVKLADFGLAKATKLNDVKSCKGTPFWMAPEVVNPKKRGYGLAADIWSLGCTVLEMLTRKIPYSHLDCVQAMYKIGGGEPPPIPDSLSRDARDFILKCLQVNPDDRPTAAQLLDHTFVKMPPPSPLGSPSPHHFNWRF